MRSWESFIPETLNQQFCRLVLSVHKKTSRLAVLGELGHYPLLISSLTKTLNYNWSLSKHDSTSLTSDALSEMESFSVSGHDCWLSRVRKIEQLFGLTTPPSYYKKESVDSIVKKRVRSVFERFRLDEVKKIKPDKNGLDRNKLRFY